MKALLILTIRRLLALALVLLSCPLAWAQQTTPPATVATVSPQQKTSATVETPVGEPELTPLVNLSQPDKYGMAFLSFEPSKEGLGFMIAPSGKIGTVPMSKLSEAAKAGYRSLTAADLMAIINGVSEEATNLQKRFKELSDDYNGLAARYNRLAAVSAANPVQVQQPVDERQAMRLMLFQNFLQRAFPGPPSQVQVQTVDCTKFCRTRLPCHDGALLSHPHGSETQSS
jgi:hypothetical protein